MLQLDGPSQADGDRPVSERPPVQEIVLAQLEVALEHDGGDRLLLAIARSWTRQEREAYQRWRELWRTYLEGLRALHDEIVVADWTVLDPLPEHGATGP